MNIYDLLNMSYLADKKQIQKELIRLSKRNKDPNFWDEVMVEYKKFQELGKEAYDKQMETKDGKEYDDKVMTSVNIVNDNSYNKSLKNLVNSYDSDGKFNINKVKISKFKLDREKSIKKPTKTSKFKKVVKYVVPIILAVGVVVFVACYNNGRDVKEPTIEPTTSYTDDSSNAIDTKFNYIVQNGDSYSSLKERFGSDCEIYSSSAMLQVYDTIVIDAHDVELKKEMDKIYEKQMKENEPIAFESYTIKPGDTLPNIANYYGVTCAQIMEYNSFIENIQEIYAGDTLKIPVYKSQTMTK